MFGNLWTRFRKKATDEDSFEREKQPVQVATPAVDAGPSGLSFEEGASCALYSFSLNEGFQ